VLQKILKMMSGNSWLEVNTKSAYLTKGVQYDGLRKVKEWPQTTV